MTRKQLRTRQEIGRILLEANVPLNAGEIRDRIRDGKRSRRATINLISLSQMLKGARGIESGYFPKEDRMRYRMIDHEAYECWLRRE